VEHFSGRTAFVTGGAGGFGVEFARLFLAEGMNVVLADIEQDALDAAAARLGEQLRVRAVLCDTADRASLAKAADEAIAAFGRIHLVCNNAGVGGLSGGVEEISDPQWDWVMAINLMGVVHGISIFLPHMRAHGEGGWFLNTASMAGMLGQPQMGPYCASKAAVVGISESLYFELKGSNIGVTVLCPGFAKTGIARTDRLMPPALAAEAKASAAGAVRAAQVSHAVATGLEPSEVAARAFAGVRDGDLYVFTHPDMKPMIDHRMQRIAKAWDKAIAFKR
jgi:NAD(P)-dependent dehydrogenase (short-subunit alcohol dehydrogenase family)